MSFEYIVFDRINNECSHCGTLERAEELVQELVDMHIGVNTDGKIGYCKVQKVVREEIVAERSKFTDYEWRAQGRDPSVDRYVECVLEDYSDRN